MVSQKYNILRDRTLVLRILDERLQSRLREKMENLEEETTKAAAAVASSQHQRGQHQFQEGHMHIPSTSASTSQSQEGRQLNLEGVTCEPAIQGSTNSDPTLWNFHCDGAIYPARLTNLPCPVEVHKTHDHAMYYKCVDVAQMLIVYEDMTELENAESAAGYKLDGFPSYFHSGLTPPMNRVVANRFSKREHSAPPHNVADVVEVEKELMELIESISTKDTKKTGRSSAATLQTKPLEEVEDEMVDYEPWMDDGGVKGIEFNQTEPKCKNHPELWLDLAEIKAQEQQSSLSLGETKVVKGKKARKKLDDNADAMSINSNTSSSTKQKKTAKKMAKKKKKKNNVSAPAAMETSPLPPESARASTPLETYALDDFDFDDIGKTLDEVGLDEDLGDWGCS